MCWVSFPQPNLQRAIALFDTALLTLTQGLLAIAAGVPVILWALLLQRFDPIN